jgi:deoxyadenosine/deoxycytidine kinase
MAALFWRAWSKTRRSHLRPVRVVTLEGLIGCGKTTQLRLLAAAKNSSSVRIIEEPVAEWEEHGLLAAAYDGTLNKAVFQHAVLMSLAAPLLRALHDPDVQLVISERSPWSNRAVFARCNLTDARELAAYEYTFSKVLESLCDRPVCVDFVYLNVDAKVALDRMRERGRKAEHGITLTYLDVLKRAHDALVADPTCVVAGRLPPCCTFTTHTIDASRDLASVFADLREFV